MFIAKPKYKRLMIEFSRAYPDKRLLGHQEFNQDLKQLVDSW